MSVYTKLYFTVNG